MAEADTLDAYVFCINTQRLECSFFGWYLTTRQRKPIITKKELHLELGGSIAIEGGTESFPDLPKGLN